MKVTLATLKTNLRKMPELSHLSGSAINRVVSCFTEEIFSCVSQGNTVSIPGLMTLQPRLKLSKLYFDVTLRELAMSKEHYAVRVILSRKLAGTLAAIPTPSRTKEPKTPKRKVSKK